MRSRRIVKPILFHRSLNHILQPVETGALNSFAPFEGVFGFRKSIERTRNFGKARDVRRSDLTSLEKRTDLCFSRGSGELNEFVNTNVSVEIFLPEEMAMPNCLMTGTNKTVMDY